MLLRPRNPVLIVAIVVLAIAAAFAVKGLPYDRFSWTNVVSAQGGVYGAGGPGCEIAIPAGSVVGQFLTDAVVYWEPNLGSGSPYIIDDQDDLVKTAWVVGQDETGTFYKIIWACQEVWVLKSTMSPNPDAVWQSTPLPTGIVE